MSRVTQPEGRRGSLKWIQRCVNQYPELLNAKIISQLDGAREIIWLSPLAPDQFAEYRDGDFLRLVNLAPFIPQLQDFWPSRGPQWDALARTDKDDVLLIEAKAHLQELHSPPSGAGLVSMEKIRRALGEASAAYGAPAEAAWHEEFYQLANRLAHLYFLRRLGIPAWLVLVNFVGDLDMRGPDSNQAWEQEYENAFAVLGIAREVPLLRHVLHVDLDIRLLP
jgi:hypothetical protein